MMIFQRHAPSTFPVSSWHFIVSREQSHLAWDVDVCVLFLHYYVINSFPCVNAQIILDFTNRYSSGLFLYSFDKAP